MPEPKQKIERHNELWKQGSTGLARLVTGILVFSLLVVVKVFTPFVDKSVDLKTNKTKLPEIENRLQRNVQSQNDLESREKLLKKVQGTISNSPWNKYKDTLITDIVQINSWYRELYRSSDNLNHWLQQKPVQREEPGTRYELQLQQRSIQREGPGAKLQRSAQPKDPKTRFAEKLIQRDPQLLKANDVSYKKRLTDLYRQQIQEKADMTIQEIRRSVQEKVIKPFRDLDKDANTTDALAIAAAFNNELEKWYGNVDEEQWYQTIENKGITLNKLSNLLDRQGGILLQPITKRLKSLGTEKDILEEESEKVTNEQIRLTEDIGALEAQLQKILPAWAKELVSAEQMLQLFPFVIIVILFVVAYRAWSLRSHFLVVRSSHEPRELSYRDPAMSSMWTLVWRGTMATLVTFAVYIGSCIVVWWVFEYSSDRLLEWLTTDAPGAFLRQAQVIGIRWIGRLVLSFAVVGICYILLRECRIANA